MVAGAIALAVGLCGDAAGTDGGKGGAGGRSCDAGADANERDVGR